MAKFECNEWEGLSCVDRLSKMDPSARWHNSEEEQWANGGIALFIGGGFYCQFFEDEREIRCRITYSSYKGFPEESIKALLEESVKTPIVLARRY